MALVATFVPSNSLTRLATMKDYKYDAFFSVISTLDVKPVPQESSQPSYLRNILHPLSMFLYLNHQFHLLRYDEQF